MSLDILITQFVRANQLNSEFRQTALSYYLPLLSLIEKNKGKDTLVLGINGAQGSGKSTLADFIAVAASELFGWNVTCLSLDDIYHTKTTRLQLAQDLHPLFATRGVPGTHDLDLGVETLNKLRQLEQEQATLVPRFDKAIDDQYPQSEWHIASGRQDLIIFEGWCVGCQAQTNRDLEIPINDLERIRDADGSWRRAVNSAIEQYQSRLWSQLDLLVMLKVPSFEQVYLWRAEQEQKLVQALGRATELSDPDKLKYFISHYERLTRHMLDNLGDVADVVMQLNEAHQVYSVNPDLPPLNTNNP